MEPRPELISDIDPLARLDAAHVLAALGLVREGTIFDLGTELGPDMPVGPADTFAGFRLTPYRTPRNLRGPFRGHDFSMEVLSGSPHVGSHMDGLAHIQFDGRIYGGHLVVDAYGDSGWAVNGMEGVPPIVTRGVLLDLPRELSGGAPLADEYEVTIDDVERSIAAAAISIRPGDAVLVRTGKYAADYERDPAAYFGPQPGVGPDAALWLWERGMALLGTDTSGTEAYPFPNPERTTHRVLVVERGIHLLEILDLERLAASGKREFLLICLPLKIRGGTGSWVRPIAII
jgi:kynurenine formamidase